jgi:hypothetical protein
MDRTIPALSGRLAPPLVLGAAALTTAAYRGEAHDALIARIQASSDANPPDLEEAAWTYDAAIAAQLSFRRKEAADLQAAALTMSPVFRVRGSGGEEIRLLAIVGPGDLMTNTPVDFLTASLPVRLDLLYIHPDRPLPGVVPDHDVAIFALGEANPAMLARLRWLYAVWPRPALNNPRFLPAMRRDTLSKSLAGEPALISPRAVAASMDRLRSDKPVKGLGIPFPMLIRPQDSHAGARLSRVADVAELSDYLRFSPDEDFFLTEYRNYRGADGLFRKYRVAFVGRQPFLCHMAVSDHWMVHYLNAGMAGSFAKRAEEAEAMATFDRGFAQRHAAAFEALHRRLGFDYYAIDCAETRDGKLLVFEADTAAIVHAMDPPDVFPYKQPQMQRIFGAFFSLLRDRTDRYAPRADRTILSFPAAPA